MDDLFGDAAPPATSSTATAVPDEEFESVLFVARYLKIILPRSTTQPDSLSKGILRIPLAYKNIYCGLQSWRMGTWGLDTYV